MLLFNVISACVMAAGPNYDDPVPKALSLLIDGDLSTHANRQKLAVYVGDYCRKFLDVAPLSPREEEWLERERNVKERFLNAIESPEFYRKQVTAFVAECLKKTEWLAVTPRPQDYTTAKEYALWGWLAIEFLNSDLDAYIRRLARSGILPAAREASASAADMLAKQLLTSLNLPKLIETFPACAPGKQYSICR